MEMSGTIRQVTRERSTRAAPAAVGKPILSLSLLKNPTCMVFFSPTQAEGPRLSLPRRRGRPPGPAASSRPAGVPQPPHNGSHRASGTDAPALIYPGPFTVCPKPALILGQGILEAREFICMRERRRRDGPLGTSGAISLPGRLLSTPGHKANPNIQAENPRVYIYSPYPYGEWSGWGSTPLPDRGRAGLRGGGGVPAGRGGQPGAARDGEGAGGSCPLQAGFRRNSSEIKAIHRFTGW